MYKKIYECKYFLILVFLGKIRISFEEKPTDDVREILTLFKYSYVKSYDEWTKSATPTALEEVKDVVRHLNNLRSF